MKYQLGIDAAGRTSQSACGPLHDRAEAMDPSPRSGRWDMHPAASGGVGNRSGSWRDLDDELIEAALAGAFEELPWMAFLDRLRVVCGADYAALNIRPPGVPFLEALNVVSGSEDSRGQVLYSKRFHPSDVPVNTSLSEGRPYSLEELLALDNPSARALREIVRDEKFAGLSEVRVSEPFGVHAWLSMVRQSSDFDDSERQVLGAIAPMLRNGLRTYVALEQERFHAAMTREGARRFQFGWFTLDLSGRVLASDEQGGEVLATSGILSVRTDGRLTAAEGRVQQEIRRALANAERNSRGAGTAIAVSRDPWLNLLLMPARGLSPLAGVRPSLIAYVHRDPYHSAGKEDELIHVFSLTRTEARLAVSLCRGLRIAEAAVELGIAVETARSYSKSLYAKTSTRGLPDLVRMLLQSAWSLPSA